MAGIEFGSSSSGSRLKAEKGIAMVSFGCRKGNDNLRYHSLAS
jgi:hypothetical protein